MAICVLFFIVYLYFILFFYKHHLESIMKYMATDTRLSIVKDSREAFPQYQEMKKQNTMYLLKA